MVVDEGTTGISHTLGKLNENQTEKQTLRTRLYHFPLTMDNNHNGGGQPQNQDGMRSMMQQQQGTGQGGYASAMASGAQQVPPHMMSLMTNPALAAAAAASPLFPPAAMLSNPGAFLAMPGAFGAMGGMQGPQGSNVGNSGASGMMIPNMMMMNAQGGHGMAPIAPMGTMSGFQTHGGVGINMQALSQGMGNCSGNEQDSRNGKGRRTELTPDQRARQNRDRNREHARSTRLRKKAYVQKLKELVEGLHAERTEEVRQRRVAIQHLAETQNVRRAVVRSFLRFHANFEQDERKWSTILEEDAWLKQPVTPYRSFRRAEIEQVSSPQCSQAKSLSRDSSMHVVIQECRVSRGIEATICDAASLSVMIENIGGRSHRWMQLKREEFLALECSKRRSMKMPNCIIRQDSRLQHAVSSLSSSSGSSNHASSGEDSSRLNHRVAAKHVPPSERKEAASTFKMPEPRNEIAAQQQDDDRKAKAPDPNFADSEDSPFGEDSPEDSKSSANDTKRITTDSSSGDDSAGALNPRPAKKRKQGSDQGSSGSSLPSNIAKKGGIPHNIQPVIPQGGAGNVNARLGMAPAVPLPFFAGIGKKTTGVPGRTTSRQSGEASRGQGPAVISADVETSSSGSNGKTPRIHGSYHVNEDDMILMDDILMCPFIFRSQDAVLCGALAECTMPGMLRTHFSSRNKLKSVEMVYDAMGFMQQLERASGNEGSAHIIPGSLEMALSPNTADALIITLAEAPFLIVNVNELWTRMTGYTQMEAEGREYLSLVEGEGTVPEAGDRPGKPKHRLDEVAKGRCACSTNIHYDKQGRDFVEFVCSYPLTNANNEVTHLLHVCKELPSVHASMNT